MSENLLIILQYNIKNQKNSTIMSLFADPTVKNFDILAIQKPWRNVFVTTSYNSSSFDFHLTYHATENARVCFYVNIKIDSNTWKIKHHLNDFITFVLHTHSEHLNKVINIYNIYNSSSILYNFIDNSTMFYNLINALDAPREHLIVENFNLHHSYWGGPFRVIHHVMADLLLNIIENRGLNLTLPKSIITWERNT